MGKFKPGVDPRRGKGGKRPNSGRPTKKQTARRQWVEAELRKLFFQHGKEIVDEAIRLGKGGKVKKGSSPATIRHMVDKLLPPVERVQHSGSVIYNTNLDKPKK